MSMDKNMRRYIALCLIKSYLMFNDTATSKELALWLDNNFKVSRGYTSDDVANIIKYGRLNMKWFNVEGSERRPKKWRLKD